MLIADKLLVFLFRCMFWVSLFSKLDKDIQSIKTHVAFDRSLIFKGEKYMFDKKTMKLIKFESIRKYIMKGTQVFMVMVDGELITITSETNMEDLIFHNLTGGYFAVYRKKFDGIGSFNRSIKIGNWTFAIGHTKKEGDGICV